MVASDRGNRGNNRRPEQHQRIWPTPGGDFFQKSLSTSRCVLPLELVGQILNHCAMLLQNADMPQSDLAGGSRTVE